MKRTIEGYGKIEINDGIMHMNTNVETAKKEHVGDGFAFAIVEKP